MFSSEQIAPCGMNCGACSAYLAFTHGIPTKRGKITHCAGCRARNKNCAYLKGHCRLIAKGLVPFCFKCRDFPCARLSHLDDRYRTCYGVSPVGNLLEIRDTGVSAFLRHQADVFRCPKCGLGPLSIHNRRCFDCETITGWRE